MNKLRVQDRWSTAETAHLTELDLLVYQSRLVGSDPGLVVWGGGNTSLKVFVTDYRGRICHVLRVKGTGSDLKAVVPRDFPALRMDDLLSLLEREQMSDEDMVEYLDYALLEPHAPRPSIETLLHAFVPARSVVHSHADAILALTNNQRRDEILREVYGEEVAIIPYLRPGFALSRMVGLIASNPQYKAAILLNHGLITWHDDPSEAYHLHIEMVNRAADYVELTAKAQVSLTGESLTIPGAQKRREIAAILAPTLRGLLSKIERVVVHFDDSDDVLDFVTGRTLGLERVRAVIDAGAATPDHILNTKRSPLWIEPADLSDAQAVAAATRTALEQYRRDYYAYFEQHQRGEPQLTSLPRVVLVAGLGMFAVGKDSRGYSLSRWWTIRTSLPLA